MLPLPALETWTTVNVSEFQSGFSSQKTKKIQAILVVTAIGGKLRIPPAVSAWRIFSRLQDTPYPRQGTKKFNRIRAWAFSAPRRKKQRCVAVGKWEYLGCLFFGNDCLLPRNKQLEWIWGKKHFANCFPEEGHLKMKYCKMNFRRKTIFRVGSDAVVLFLSAKKLPQKSDEIPGAFWRASKAYRIRSA